MNRDTAQIPPSIEKALRGAYPCDEAFAWLCSLPTDTSVEYAYENVTEAQWLPWGCGQRPASEERARKLVGAAALFVRPLLPCLEEDLRQVATHVAEFMEAISQSASMTPNNSVWITAARYDSGVAERYAISTAARAAQHSFFKNWSYATAEAAFVPYLAVKASIVSGRAFGAKMPSVDEVRNVLNPVSIWL